MGRDHIAQYSYREIVVKWLVEFGAELGRRCLFRRPPPTARCSTPARPRGDTVPFASASCLAVFEIRQPAVPSEMWWLDLPQQEPVAEKIEPELLGRGAGDLAGVGSAALRLLRLALAVPHVCAVAADPEFTYRGRNY